MIHVIYNKDYQVSFNDGAIRNFAKEIVLAHGNTQNTHVIEVGQELFVSALRSCMRENNVPYTNITMEIHENGEIYNVVLNDYYRWSDYTHLPDIVCEILFPLL